jgi:hypothetical protein
MATEEDLVWIERHASLDACPDLSLGWGGRGRREQAEKGKTCPE